MKSRDAWVRVKDVSELKPGSYRIVNCAPCHRTHAVFIVGRGEMRPCIWCGICRGWRVIDCSTEEWCGVAPLHLGEELYRLADHQLTESDNHERAPCEREEVR